MNREDIRDAFCGENLHSRIALDYESDIAPMLADGSAKFASFTGESISDALNQLAQSGILQSAKAIVFNIVTGNDVELKMSDLTPLNDFLSTLSKDVEVTWGIAADYEQSSKVTVNILSNN